jgi:sensor histidine kinase regulating citrate/malate metabolism
MDNHSDRPEILAASTEGWGQSIRKSATLKGNMIYTAVRILDPQGKPSGYVRLARSLERLDDLTAGFRRITWVAAVVVILMGMLACYFFLEMRLSREERLRGTLDVDKTK